MQRRDFLRTGATAGLLVTAGCSTGAQVPEFRDGFEDGLGLWSPAAAIGPEVDLEEFDWTVEVSDEEAAAGSWSLRIWNEGDFDDGTTWVTHPIQVEAGQAYEVMVSGQFWSESESFNTLRDGVMRLGPGRPQAEEDFPHPGVNTTALGETPYGGLREPLWLTNGWREYRFQWTSPTLATDTLYLSLGTSVIWEGQATHYIDEVTVEFAAR